MAEDKKFYWLKLKRDFFKRHDVRVIEDMPNGKEYILFYLKLLVESIDHEGELMFSETIPYNEQMLSSVTNTNVDIVRNAIQIFRELEMVEILDTGAIYMTEVQKMVGKSTQDEQQLEAQRERQKKYRERQKLLKASQEVSPLCNNNITRDGEIEIDIEKDLEIDIERELEIKRTGMVICDKIPTLDEVKDYCKENSLHIQPQKFFDYYSAIGWKIKGHPIEDWKALVRTWESREKHPTNPTSYDSDQVKQKAQKEIVYERKEKPKVEIPIVTPPRPARSNYGDVDSWLNASQEWVNKYGTEDERSALKS